MVDGVNPVCSYVDRLQHGKGPSTASQTAWALLSLMAAGEWQHEALKRGITYLCNTQLEDGTWDELYFTGCGFPGYGIGKRVKDLPKPGEPGYQGPEMPAAFMINYNLYRHYWPLMALDGINVIWILGKSEVQNNEYYGLLSSITTISLVWSCGFFAE